MTHKPGMFRNADGYWDVVLGLCAIYVVLFMLIPAIGMMIR